MKRGLPTRIPCPDAKAEGDAVLLESEKFGPAYRVPYATEVANIDGCAMHFWLGEIKPTKELLRRLAALGRYTRDVVDFTFSDGNPESYWAHQDMQFGE